VTTVPDVVGLAAVDACTAVIAADLIPAGPDDAPAPEYGTVVEQTPEPGLPVAPRSVVVLVSATAGHGAAPTGPTPADADALTPA
jgi:beta-lactam-binding protein with PASTA domain